MKDRRAARRVPVATRLARQTSHKMLFSVCTALERLGNDMVSRFQGQFTGHRPRWSLDL